MQNGFLFVNPYTVVSKLWPVGVLVLVQRGWTQHKGFSGFSHSAFQSMTTAVVRGRRDLAMWSVERGAVMAEMARRAHFTPPSEWLQISCTALLIGNTFETSFRDHTYGVQKKEKGRGKKKDVKGSKNEIQSMSKCTELTLDLTNTFQRKTSIFPTWNKS